MIPVLTALALAAGMFSFGTWGRRNADSLVPQAFSAYGKAKKAQQMRRNARLIQVSAGVLALIAVGDLVFSAVSR
jgi:hypothetical protein